MPTKSVSSLIDSRSVLTDVAVLLCTPVMQFQPIVMLIRGIDAACQIRRKFVTRIVPERSFAFSEDVFSPHLCPHYFPSYPRLALLSPLELPLLLVGAVWKTLSIQWISLEHTCDRHRIGSPGPARYLLRSLDPSLRSDRVVVTLVLCACPVPRCCHGDGEWTRRERMRKDL